MYFPSSIDKSLFSICEEIAELTSPQMMYIFGVKTNYENGKVSDADICIIGDYGDANQVAHLVYEQIDGIIPFDLFIYTKEQWDEKTADNGSFAARIKRQGRLVYEK